MICLRNAVIVDFFVLALYVVVSFPSVTGVAIHEWLSVGVFAVLVAHCVQHYDWFVDASKSVLKAKTIARRARLILDVAMAVALAVVMVSGLLISGAILPAFGLYADGYYFWDPLHAASAKVLLALLLIHLATNLGVVVRYIRKGALAGSQHDVHEGNSDGKAVGGLSNGRRR